MHTVVSYISAGARHVGENHAKRIAGAITMTQTFRDAAHYWRSPLLPDAELLTAEYYEQEFAPHWHETYSIPVIQDGAQTYRYRGALRLAGAGSIASINPGEVHTGERATDRGWAYRAFYPSAEWMRQLAGDIGGRT